MSRLVSELLLSRSIALTLGPPPGETHKRMAAISDRWKRKPANYSPTCWFLGWGRGCGWITGDMGEANSHQAGHRPAPGRRRAASFCASSRVRARGWRFVTGHSPTRSRRRNAAAPTMTAAAPMAVITPPAVQFGADAGAGAIWWNKEVSSSQWLLFENPPTSVTRIDHTMRP